jgi:cell division transport system permease protein
MKIRDRLFSRKYRYDIALEEGVGAYLVTWITGLMVFFMMLALAVNLGLNALAQTWVNGLSGSITVEIQPPLPQAGAEASPAAQKAFEDSVHKILWLAGQHPAVAEGRALPAEEIRNLIRPWLGDKMSAEVPLPALIDLKLKKDADLGKLQTDIRSLVPAATVDTHGETLDDVKALIGAARVFVLLLTGVILLLAAAAISSIVRAKLAIHAQEVETLHLIGASDEYIARQFRQHTLKGTLKGAALGIACMSVTLLALSSATGGIEAAILPRLNLAPLAWAAVLLTPVLFGALVAHFTAQKTVMRELVKLP